MKKTKKIFQRYVFRIAVLIAACLVIFGGLYAISLKRADIQEAWNKRGAPVAVAHLPVALPAPVRPLEAQSSAAVVLDSELIPLPESFDLAVPFTSQAPYAAWDAVHKEACEEASLSMVHAFYEGVSGGKIEAAKAEQRIQEIVAFERKTFGFFEDTDAEQTAQIAREFYGYQKIEILIDPSVEDIKRQLVAGRPVIVPSAGRLLGNPFYNQPGPIYHMLVLRGYTKTKFITNDPGTRRGEGYQYSFDVVMQAMRDWNNGDVLNGRKVVLVIYPNSLTP